MDASLKKNGLSVILGTVVAINMMLAGLLIANQVVTLPALPVSSESAHPALQTEVQLEWVGSRIVGNWRIEQYRKMEVQLDEKGKIVKKRPTPEMTYMRYWNKPVNKGSQG
ncbi:hypothetical protein SAMN05444487_111143 [Marininema mesophilum]|uniref:Uncharacterized protein n=1 Tax=Marininema mesophilum TaxID=1048340 RepID=A0A1H2ZN76_9BACL|nr:hypothetical protein [Marininema mesophilum]SDX18982.1 hypothetical protein SAMN05444487_111143 [Marininema mesophilum]